MRACVISDIHGNLHALEAVLHALAQEKADEVWCLGDLVGYGPRPNECCRLVAAWAGVSLVGNHDLAVLGRLDLAEFSLDAAESARWTTSALEDGPRTYLESLSSTAVREGVGLYHASARDPVWEYVLSEEAAAASLVAADEGIVLVGHSHVALAFGLGREGPAAAWWERVGGGKPMGGLAPAGTQLDLATAKRWLLNPGSVGQPRDGDPRAAYLVLDLDGGRAHFRRVEYAIERTQAEIRERGLPEPLAARLEHGV